MSNLIKVSQGSKALFDKNSFIKVLPHKPVLYFSYRDAQVVEAWKTIYFEKTIVIPEELFLPVYVELKGYVDDDLLVDNKSVAYNIDPSPYFSPVGAHYFNYTFISNKPSFTVAAKDNYGGGAVLNIDISFVPVGPFYYQYVNTSF
jgi:hypothetical protein